MKLNFLKKVVEKTCKETVVIKTLFGQETFHFLWNNPATDEEIIEFENKNECKLPSVYKEFLLVANGGIIFKSENEDDGYKLLSIAEIDEVTREMRNNGYDIVNNIFCFMQCLFSQDILLFDLNKEKKYILDGDVGYPSNEWEYINADVNTFFIRLFQCNGAMYWRW